MEATSVGLAVAFAAGLLSFLSPCVLPLIPSYVTFVTGMSLDELTAEDEARTRARRAVLIHGTLFVVGFTLVFMLMGASVTFLGSLFAYASRWIERIGGVILILFALYLFGFLRIPGASRDWRVHVGDKPVGYVGTVLVGVAFGAGWTPCLGPVLSGILMLAMTSGSLAQGIGLLFIYSLGLAIPFLLAAFLLQHFLGSMKRIAPWMPWITRITGALLLVLGIMLLTGSFTTLTAIFAQWTPEFLLERL